MKLFGKKKIQLPNEVRMQYSAPSFSFYIGKRFEVKKADEAEAVIRNEGGAPVVLLIPGIDFIESSSQWVKALLPSSYVVVLAKENDKYLSSFMDKLEKQIFSPIPKLLSGAILLDNESEAAELLLGISSREKKKCLTLVVR